MSKGIENTEKSLLLIMLLTFRFDMFDQLSRQTLQSTFFNEQRRLQHHLLPDLWPSLWLQGWDVSAVDNVVGQRAPDWRIHLGTGTSFHDYWNLNSVYWSCSCIWTLFDRIKSLIELSVCSLIHICSKSYLHCMIMISTAAQCLSCADEAFAGATPHSSKGLSWYNGLDENRN